MQDIMEKLEQKSPFELSRIRTYINQRLEDPTFTTPLKRSLSIGQKVSYFEQETNTEIDVIIEKIGRTNAHVREIISGKSWTMPFHMLNVNCLTTDLPSTSNKGGRGVNRYDLRVGESVSFQIDFSEVFGEVIKLNPRRAKVLLKDGAIWNVYYSHLSRVIETSGVKNGTKLLDVIVVQ